MNKFERLKQELTKYETKPCKLCNNSAKVFNRDAVYIVRCNSCGHSARGYIIDFCLKTEYDYQKSIKKLVESWNERN